jgi:hypothetical protein
MIQEVQIDAGGGLRRARFIFVVGRDSPWSLVGFLLQPDKHWVVCFDLALARDDER